MTQQEFWNQKFSRDGYLYGKEPNHFLKECSSNFKISQEVLCLGEGEGRNAIFLAKEGYKVLALDASNVGLKKLTSLAKEEEVEVKTQCIDLSEWTPKKKYGAIVFSYLHLLTDEKTSLFEKIQTALHPQGFFVAEVFSKSQLNYNSGGPKERDLLYAIEDFKDAFEECVIHKLEEVEVNLAEGRGHNGKASVIRIIAQRN